MNKEKNHLHIIVVVLIMVILSAFFGLFCNLIVKAKEGTSEDTTELFTSEEQESIDKANHLSDQDHRNILNASQKFLDSLGDLPEVATSTDADFDTHAYFTYGLDQEWFDSDTPEYKMFDDIYRMILSIRNCIVVLIIGLVCVWVHKTVKSVILSFGKGGRNT